MSRTTTGQLSFMVEAGESKSQISMDGRNSMPPTCCADSRDNSENMDGRMFMAHCLHNISHRNKTREAIIILKRC
ncbi:hypothetical protein XELAEV_18015668mg [Xenopus laevis]|uniref:Uncharacterized protein n=1 Tax=Xenopus laevis TaxID=8355 RepID=A0A974HWM6_XENLA|nr:hypothetical protein XELAEV_18015668mg [Xenopus laevis]